MIIFPKHTKTSFYEETGHFHPTLKLFITTKIVLLNHAFHSTINLDLNISNAKLTVNGVEEELIVSKVSH